MVGNVYGVEMTSRVHAVVWIDHREARIFHFDRSGVDGVVIHPNDPTVHIHHKANTIGSGHAAVDSDYLHEVAAALAGSEKILITGPAQAKSQLESHMRAHDPLIAAHIIGVETVDHPTDKQLVAHARVYFKADHQILPRS
jgi:stalled ribosome rescue protein Dom34